ncbi:MAG: hypothetical protein U0L98_03630 [Clostridia bacterium]|nr:hypothetical protein [Clostridia bacterium]
MDRMKTFLKYAIWGILFFIFSEFLISVGLNSSYKKMSATYDINTTKEVEITEAESTLVNGKVKGKIKYDEEQDIEGKYLRMDFLSKRDNVVGTKYIPITANKENPVQDFDAFFELQDVTSYKTSIVDKKEVGEIKFIPEEMKRPEIILLTIVTLLIFW